MFKTIISCAAALVTITWLGVLLTQLKNHPSSSQLARGTAIASALKDPVTAEEVAALEKATIDISGVQPSDPEESARAYVLDNVPLRQQDSKFEVMIRPNRFQTVRCYSADSEEYFRAWAIMVHIRGPKRSYGEFRGGSNPSIIFFKNGVPAGHSYGAGKDRMNRTSLCPDGF